MATTTPPSPSAGASREANGWTIISDTSWEGYEFGAAQRHARLLRAGARGGRAAMAAGADACLRAGRRRRAGRRGDRLSVGGAARSGRPSSSSSRKARIAGSRAIAAGKPALASGNADTVMGGLACREISPVTWPVVGEATDWFMTIEEDEVMPARRLFAHPLDGDPADRLGTVGLCRAGRPPARLRRRSRLQGAETRPPLARSADQQRRQPRRAAGMNRLGAETSPYLLQHANNPCTGGRGARRRWPRRKRTNRPILLSVGYAACHWCHVMAHESFESPEVAAVMNELFVNIKVDREERPDVDAIYMQALHILGEQGGWPLTMFCTPDGRAVLGRHLLPLSRAVRPAELHRRAARRGPGLPRQAAGRRDQPRRPAEGAAAEGGQQGGRDHGRRVR